MFNAVIGIIFFLVVVLYLIFLLNYASRLKKVYNEYWESIGRPSFWDPNGQVAILNSVFFGNQLPKGIAQGCRTRIAVIRVLAIIGAFLFAVIIFMVYRGDFNS